MNDGFDHYLQAGHGRAYLIAKTDPERYREKIMEACRKDYTFDMQMEGSRAFLTADLIELFDDPKPFLDVVVESFLSEDVDNAYGQIQYLSDLLMEFDGRKTVLEKYIILRNKIKDTPREKLKERTSHLLDNWEYLAIKLIYDAPWKTAENIIKDMGRWYIETGNKEGREFLWFYSCLEEEYGEEETKDHILEMAKTSKEASEFCAHYTSYEWKSPASSETPPTADEVVKIFASGKELRGIDIIHMGIRKMSEEEKQKLAKIAVETDSLALRSQIVSLYFTDQMKWPLEVSYLISWCGENDAALRAACEEALSLFESDEIREYAISNKSIELIIRNFRPEDEDLLMSLLEKVDIDEEDENNWHGIGRMIIQCKLPDRFLCWVYETTLCSFCRQSVVEDLMERGTLPDEYRKECRWDARLEIRNLVDECEEKYDTGRNE